MKLEFYVVCHFSFGHCVVCPPRLTDSDYSFDIFKPFLLWCGFYIRPFYHIIMTLSPFVVCGKISGHVERDIQWVIAHLFLYLYQSDFIQRLPKKKTMYWTLQERSMSNPRKVFSFHSVSTSKMTVRGKAISSWMQMKKIK